MRRFLFLLDCPFCNLKLFLVIYLLWIITACVKDSKTSDVSADIANASKITIGDSKNVKKVSLGDILSFEKFILLESDSSNLISEISKLITYNNLVYILDKKQSCLKIYDKDGVFIRNVTKLGKGPGEVTRLIDFCIDEKARMLILYDIGTGAVQFYGLEGGFKRQVSFFPYFLKMDIIRPGILLFYSGNNFFEETNAMNFITCNYEGKLLDGALPFDKETCQLYAFGGVITHTKQGILCTNGVSNLVYLLTSDEEGILGVRPRYYLDFGKKGLIEGDCSAFNAEWTQSKLRYLYSDFYEIEKNIFFNYLDENIFKRAFLIKNNLITEDNLIDDYWSRLIDSIVDVDGENVICDIRPENIFSLFDNDAAIVAGLKSANPDLYELCLKAQKDENYIIAFSRLNKE